MERTYDFPVFGTQGGGLVQEVSRNIYVFVEAPDVPGLKVGDYMPDEWGIIAANQAATRMIDDEQFEMSPLDHELDMIAECESRP